MMAELLASLLAALIGVLLDRFTTWQKAQRAAKVAEDRLRLRRRQDADRTNRQIDEEIARETDLGAVVDQL
ncbi:MAG: hypothetical protein RIC24_00465 [Hyphomicrobiales bacterium]|jgi:hypothetical protein